MKNLTDYSDQYILSLMEDCDINPHKATANVQMDLNFKWYLTIWQELPSQMGWDELVTLVFSEEKELLDFCGDMCISAWDARQIKEFWDEVYDPTDFHVERRIKEELLAADYYAELQADYEVSMYEQVIGM